MSPERYCQRKAARSGSSFYYSFLFLPPPQRRAITALYAFCREVDDVVDEGGDAQAARDKLAWWRDELERAYAGNPGNPVTRALAPAARAFGLPQELLAEIIDGMEMDLTLDRYADFKALQLYCYRVASTVGLLAAEIFGYRDRHTLKYAHDLGLAFQLTNIIRDVGEDARRGRIYLPLEELDEFGVSAADILQGRHSDAFRRLMEYQVDRAVRYYKQALYQLPDEDRRAQRPGLVMAAIYRTLLDEIRQGGCRVLERRTDLAPLRRLWIAWRAWKQG
ncbi:MAG TPA: presqualene diphosphate synthase HpnD [Candidatus Desulfobacillus sp.]|nr:presqualene diphosphate synthase HpnD [Candidatus Desulfobacillus sp.]